MSTTIAAPTDTPDLQATAQAAKAAPTHTELAIGGMTCASCVARIERKLGKLDGVQSAQVNLATEHASVAYDASKVAVADLVRTVEAAGYTARPLDLPPASVPQTENGLARQELAITGMTCASCVARIERKLGKVPGVQTAEVNLATERASVLYDPLATNPAQLISVVEATGYGAAPVAEHLAESEDELAVHKRGLVQKPRQLGLGMVLSAVVM